MERTKTYKILTVLLPMQWAFVQFISNYPDLIETYYSNGLYPWISKCYRLLLGWIPFSVGDILYAAIVVFIVYHVVISIRKRTFLRWITLFKLGALASVIFFFFNLNWGLNYYREPLHKNLNISYSDYSADELYEITSELVHKVNAAHLTITDNDTVLVSNPSKTRAFGQTAKMAYKNLETQIPMFDYDFRATKKSIFSLPLTYMGFAGYLNPLTNEAQVNALVPKNNYPATLCHEIAHQLGISSESEANFVGYLAAIASDDPYFNYAGYLMATRYCLFELYRMDEEKFDTLSDRMNLGIKKDIQQSRAFWQGYQNWSEKYFKSAYDTYLKANKQKDGIRGYNKMVKFIVNYYKSNQI